MARKKAAPAPSVNSVTLERAVRLYRLLQQMEQGAQTRTSLTRKLRLGVRGFYRDLEVLRAVGVAFGLATGRYVLEEDLAAAVEKLPFPDPGLTLGDARLLARGRTRAHHKIKELLGRIEA
ncbi:MAG: hypothetical protein U0793_26945 [Gemmataceae bacterium]